jgi:hypothetical protein
MVAIIINANYSPGNGNEVIEVAVHSVHGSQLFFYMPACTNPVET